MKSQSPKSQQSQAPQEHGSDCGTWDSGTWDLRLTTMAKAEIKTKKTDASVEKFLNDVPDEEQRADAFKVLDMMKRITGEEPKMWGTSIVGFGELTYKSPATGREVDWMKIGFSPRKGNLSLYVLNQSSKQGELVEKLGKHKTGKGCLYIKRLSDVDNEVLKQVITSGWEKVLYALEF